ncbi:lipoprotein insertase outer membrane protein LolB [Alteromonas halophila]|uniref:Outer-membrane lipoprotein LolB n=1 Tax=Alteromonas halophila TaxID=516698 RepID=A0A918JDQ7_9ALTE|nr:lipoprotein insertase outer membrane protein LolB [Alteromonas halophila]GGW75975.1 outer-membrane lipoprotein LolB [Alteromonas halophila]
MTFRLVFVSLLVVFFSACSTLPDGPQRTVDLPAQLAALEKVNRWQLRGKMAIRNQQKAVSATVIWKTDGRNFHFRLTNLLGITLADLRVNEDGATLQADGDTLRDTDAERLVASVTGLAIPLKDLLVWVKGLPQNDDRYRLNEKGLVSALWPACDDCNGWQVSYNNYGDVQFANQTVWLPHDIRLTRAQQPDILIKIRIDQWTLN